jgi:lipooligosaccharide transport system ATP-binding protein
VSVASCEPLIQGVNVTKRFGSFVAVDGIDFHVEPGEAFGFLGPNGAGKTSTMRMVGCVSTPTSGELRILGMDPAVDGSRIRARLGVVPQEDSLDTELTVFDNLLIYGRYFDLPYPEIRRRATELLEFMQLSERRDDLVDPLSGGMKRRLTIGRALINQPDLILLDEPTTGLDPQARHLLWDRFYQLKRSGGTIVLTTHYMEEAEQLCDRLVIMDGGRIVTEGSPRELVARHATREVVELRFATPEERDAALPRLTEFGERIEPLTDRVLVYTQDAGKVVALVTDGELRPESVYERRGTLEDVFLILTGRSLDD